MGAGPATTTAPCAGSNSAPWRGQTKRRCPRVVADCTAGMGANRVERDDAAAGSVAPENVLEGRAIEVLLTLLRAVDKANNGRERFSGFHP